MSEPYKNNPFPNPLLLILAFVLVLVGFGAFLFIQKEREAYEKEEIAFELFDEAEFFEEAGFILNAIDHYQTIIRQFSGSRFEIRAKYRIDELDKILQDSGTLKNTPEREAWLLQLQQTAGQVQ